MPIGSPDQDLADGQELLPKGVAQPQGSSVEGYSSETEDDYANDGHYTEGF